ncbi:hypothetical protein AB0K21_25460 [Streptosporangium sp. NPDC049248]|uniref:hypothetical protein n=1 Tax=Streptosporangium sp. NPDC049248 TaxID=3155651 RepID=UPI003446801F
MWVPGRAAICLLTASLCELVVAGVSLVVRGELEREEERLVDGPSLYGELALSKVENFLWGSAVAGMITLTLAALAWRRGGTEGVRAVMGAGLVPYTLFCWYFCFLSIFRAGEFLGGYSHLTFGLTSAAGVLYLAGTISLFLARPKFRQTG